MMFHGMPKFALGPHPRGRPDAIFGIPCQWYGLWMRVKGPDKHMVTARSSCVKWPLSVGNLGHGHSFNSLIR